ncbi:ArsC/Spx/MgsR family protein [Pseudobdellovibrio exovorus]|uniref:Arsenate reductase n=1 Tax=Pseudobdellovibrio exovorus JSS TaxID=1184267 RepID=M4VBA1_9BACT|nr:ArsC/Spx/MgsR family protein [Pseudobdellovibrio exovorus]AGH96672.1 hypothetical protein A11Q_2456 [Pseudobdellovibrio exovorus JSS]
MWTIYHNPKCSKSREALALLQSHSSDVHVIEYLKDAPTVDELKDLIRHLQGPASALVRTKEDLYQELQFDLGSEEQIVTNLSQYPQLLERPIVIKSEVSPQHIARIAVVARPVELILPLLQSESSSST